MSLNNWETPFRNDSGETIPPFGIMKVTGVVEIGSGNNKRPIVTVEKPDTYGSQYLHYINGPVEVANGKYGSCTSIFPALAKHDNSTTPSVGDLFGPRDDSWVLNPETGGFIVLDELLSNDLLIVERMPMLAFTGRFDSDTAQGSTGTVSVYWHGVDTGENVTGVYAVSSAFTTTDDVNVTKLNERWEAYCRTG